MYISKCIYTTATSLQRRNLASGAARSLSTENKTHPQQRKPESAKSGLQHVANITCIFSPNLTKRCLDLGDYRISFGDPFGLSTMPCCSLVTFTVYFVLSKCVKYPDSYFLSLSILSFSHADARCGDGSYRP